MCTYTRESSQGLNNYNGAFGILHISADLSHPRVGLALGDLDLEVFGIMASSGLF